jgi:dTDP-4-amino-4,6-dideoxygalactose transaminase
MKTFRFLPPAAAPIFLQDIISGVTGLVHGAHEQERLKDGLQRAFGAKYCYCVSSGKAALYCVLKALHTLHPDRDEVLIPAFNCYSVPSAVINAGLKVRLCDINPDTLDFDYQELAGTLGNSDRLLCIVSTHLFGLHADVARCTSLAKKYNVPVVEDAAQVMGSLENGKNLGLLADVGFFSLGRGKAFSTCEGGIIVTNNDAIGTCINDIVAALPGYTPLQTLSLLVNAIVIRLFIHPSLFWLPKSMPFLKLGGTFFENEFRIKKMGPFQAGLAHRWQDRLKCFQEQRKKNILYWASFFKSNALPGLFTHYAEALPDLLRFPVRLPNTSVVSAILRGEDINELGMAITYPLSLDELPELKDHIGSRVFPHARQCAHTLVTLPVHCFVTKRDRENIEGLLKAMVRK